MTNIFLVGSGTSLGRGARRFGVEMQRQFQLVSILFGEVAFIQPAQDCLGRALLLIFAQAAMFEAPRHLGSCPIVPMTSAVELQKSYAFLDRARFAGEQAFAQAVEMVFRICPSQPAAAKRVGEPGGVSPTLLWCGKGFDHTFGKKEHGGSPAQA